MSKFASEFVWVKIGINEQDNKAQLKMNSPAIERTRKYEVKDMVLSLQLAAVPQPASSATRSAKGAVTVCPNWRNGEWQLPLWVVVLIVPFKMMNMDHICLQDSSILACWVQMGFVLSIPFWVQNSIICVLTPERYVSFVSQIVQFFCLQTNFKGQHIWLD